MPTDMSAMQEIMEGLHTYYSGLSTPQVFYFCLCVLRVLWFLHVFDIGDTGQHILTALLVGFWALDILWSLLRATDYRDSYVELSEWQRGLSERLTSRFKTQIPVQYSLSSSRLLQLPAEIRDLIWQEVVGNRPYIYIRQLHGYRKCRERRCPLQHLRQWSCQYSYQSPNRYGSASYPADYCICGLEWNVDQIKMQQEEWKTELSLSLLQTCRQIYSEAGHLVYAQKAFCFDDPLPLTEFLKCLTMRRRDEVAMIHLCITYSGSSCMNCDDLSDGRIVRASLQRFRGLRILNIDLNEHWRRTYVAHDVYELVRNVKVLGVLTINLYWSAHIHQYCRPRNATVVFRKRVQEWPLQCRKQFANHLWLRLLQSREPLPIWIRLVGPLWSRWFCSPPQVTQFEDGGQVAFVVNDFEDPPFTNE